MKQSSPFVLNIPIPPSKLTAFTPMGIVRFYYDDEGDCVKTESTPQAAENYIKMMIDLGRLVDNGSKMAYPPSAYVVQQWVDGQCGIKIVDDSPLLR